MNVRSACLCALVVVLVGSMQVHAEDPPAPWGAPGGMPTLLDTPAVPTVAPAVPGGPEGMAAPGAAPGGLHGLSSWINHSCPDCCGPLGDGPIMSELYARFGPSVQVGGGVFSHTLETGWEFQGGGRVLLFDPSVTRAWTVDLSLVDIGNHGQHSDMVFPLFNVIEPASNALTGGTTNQLVPQQNVTVKSLNRTYVEATFGREWYLFGSGVDHTGPSWRAGADAGGLWGTAKLETHEIKHRTEVITGVAIGLHSDLEFPVCSCCIFTTGVRLQWTYTFIDHLLQSNPTDTQDLGLFWTAGVRF